jgi:hypothetical protein
MPLNSRGLKSRLDRPTGAWDWNVGDFSGVVLLGAAKARDYL